MGVELVDSIEALIDRARAPDASLAMRRAAFSLIVERYQDAAYGCALVQDSVNSWPYEGSSGHSAAQAPRSLLITSTISLSVPS